MKKKGLRNAAYVLIIFQMFSYYGGGKIPISSDMHISSILGANFFILLGIIFLFIYWSINRKVSEEKVDQDNNR